MKLPLNAMWTRNGRPLVLLATVEPWKAERAEEELGDSLYRLDPGLIVERLVQTVVAVFAAIDPDRAFQEVVRSPPAYVSRLLPVHAHLRPSLDEVAGVTRSLLAVKGVSGPVELEVRVRGGCVDAGAVEETVQAITPVRRRSEWLLRIEFVCPVGVAGLVPDRLDRVDRWRRGLNA